MHKKAKKFNSDATPIHPGKIRVNQLFQRFLLILLFLSNFPSNSEAQLSSFYSLVSSLDNKNNETSSASAKIKRSSNLFWESGTKSPITSYWTGGSLELERSRSGNNASTLPSSPAISLSEEKVENLTFFQSLLRSIAATRVREELAEISSHWANTARYVVSSKYSEVIHLTRKAHAAQLESLQKSSMAQLLNDAVSKASRVYHSSRARYEDMARVLHFTSFGVNTESFY